MFRVLRILGLLSLGAVAAFTLFVVLHSMVRYAIGFYHPQ